ncbi:hypothetical protein FB451DRAFT_1525954 [Mycena latifolia]|nr:hypothetical protein FB451DRAFT_1525954 [Mycena latifolia]
MKNGAEESSRGKDGAQKVNPMFNDLNKVGNTSDGGNRKILPLAAAAPGARLSRNLGSRGFIAGGARFALKRSVFQSVEKAPARGGAYSHEAAYDIRSGGPEDARWQGLYQHIPSMLAKGERHTVSASFLSHEQAEWQEEMTHWRNAGGFCDALQLQLGKCTPVEEKLRCGRSCSAVDCSGETATCVPDDAVCNGCSEHRREDDPNLDVLGWTLVGAWRRRLIKTLHELSDGEVAKDAAASVAGWVLWVARAWKR